MSFMMCSTREANICRIDQMLQTLAFNHSMVMKNKPSFARVQNDYDIRVSEALRRVPCLKSRQ